MLIGAHAQALRRTSTHSFAYFMKIHVAFMI